MQLKFSQIILGVLIGLLLVFLISTLFTHQTATCEKMEEYLTMSTGVQVYLRADSESQLDSGMQSVRAAFTQIERECNIFNPASEISRINNAPENLRYQVCSPNLFRLIAMCADIYDTSRGAFDPTVRPLMQLWGFHRKNPGLAPPTDSEINQARQHIGFSRVKIFRDSSAIFLPAGMSLDFGGIAKGYALDMAAEKCRDLGIFNGVLNLGGNLLIMGDEPVNIAIRDPIAKHKTALRTQLAHGACATSGNYERFVTYNGKRYPHIINPQTGLPMESKLIAVTILAPTAFISDFLSTTTFILGRDFAEDYQRQNPGTVFILFYADDTQKKGYRYEVIGTPPYPLVPEA